MSQIKKQYSDLVRLFKIGWEFIRGFHFFGNLHDVVSIFGSARLPQNHPACKLAEELAYRLAYQGFTILTGGGPSVMQAANRGASLAKKDGAKTRSLACNIYLPHEQKANPYVEAVMTMKYFFTRKYMLIHYSQAFVFFAGGVGTLDEFFEVFTLIQTGKIPKRPIYLVGTSFWNGLVTWLQQQPLKQGTIDEKTLSLFYITDDLNAVIAHLKRAKDKIHQEGESYPVNPEPKEPDTTHKPKQHINRKPSRHKRR